MTDTGETASALGRVRAAVAGAIAQGLKKKAAILAKALHQINAAKQDGFSHAQIHAAITAGGLELTPAYYENRISGYSKDTMKMWECERCHASMGTSNACFVCHK